MRVRRVPRLAALACAGVMGACVGDRWSPHSPAPEKDAAAVEPSGADGSVRKTVAGGAADFGAGAEPTGDSVDVVGRWRGVADQVEFLADGQVLLRRSTSHGEGRYEMAAPRRILITWQGALVSLARGDYAVARTDSLLSLCETDRPARCIHYTPLRPGQPPPDPGAADPGGPRLAELSPGVQLPPDARMAEARPLLRQAYALQQAYRAEHGVYAPTVDALRVVGWTPAAPRHFGQPRVVHADARRLCVVAEPLADDLWPVHIDEQGTLHSGPC